MPFAVDFKDVSTVGLESSPVAGALAGLRASEARYFRNKYDHVFTVEPASSAKTTIDWVHRILKEERDIVISSRPLEAAAFQAYFAFETITDGGTSPCRRRATQRSRDARPALRGQQASGRLRYGGRADRPLPTGAPRLA